jgi:glutamyl-tRNA reductase
LSVVVVGLEHPQAPLDLLERVAVPEEGLGKTLAVLRDNANLAEVVVLSTCLRTELYAVVDRFHDGIADLQEFLASLSGVSVDSLVEHLTVLFDDAVAIHLFEVAAGLRSAVLGETEVLGQVRRASERAAAERAAGPVLTALFRQAVQAGRRVRSSTSIARGSTSLSHIAVELAAQRLGGSLAGREVVVVGAGEMGEGIVEALNSQHGPARVVVANRTASRARAVAAAAGARAIGLDDLPDALATADAVIVSTGSSLPLLGPDVLGPVLALRRSPARLVMVDLAMPRNVDPVVGSMEGVELLDMEHLRSLADRVMDGRRSEVALAREIVWREVERYRADTRARGAAPIVSALRGRLEDLRRAELDDRRSVLDDAQFGQVDDVTRAVLAKLLHQPTVALKDAAGTPRGERLVEALRALFDL